MQFATSFMQNVSISLLSGNVFYNRSNDTAANLQDVDTTCVSLVTLYVYSPTRLLSTYGVALGLTAVVVAYGCWLILSNGREEKLVFSDVVGIALNEELFGLSGNLQGQTRVHLVGGNHASGQLLPVLPVDESVEKSQVSYNGTTARNRNGGCMRYMSPVCVLIITVFLSSVDLIELPLSRPLEDGASRSGDFVLHDIATPLLPLSEWESAEFFITTFKFFHVELGPDGGERHRHCPVVRWSSVPGGGDVRLLCSTSMAQYPVSRSHYLSNRCPHENARQSDFSSRLSRSWSLVKRTACSAPCGVYVGGIHIRSGVDKSLPDSQRNGGLHSPSPSKFISLEHVEHDK